MPDVDLDTAVAALDVSFRALATKLGQVDFVNLHGTAAYRVQFIANSLDALTETLG